MEYFNRILYGLCTASVVLTAALLMLAIWGSFEEEWMWKACISGFIMMLASGTMLGINLQIAKTRAEIEAKKKGKSEQNGCM